MERAARDEASSSLLGKPLEFQYDDLQRYEEEASSSSLFCDENRVFIVWNCKKVPPLPDGQKDLLIAVSIPGKESLSDPRSKRSLNFPKFKVFGDRNEYVGWILKEGERFNIDLNRVAVALFVNSGKRLRKLSSEIQKLASAATSGSVVTPELARSVLCFSAEITPKDIIDALSEGKTSAAIAYYERLQTEGDETGWILAYMHRHVLQMLRFAIMTDTKMSDQDISDALGITPYVLKNFVRPLHGRWSSSSLLSSVKSFSNMDEMNKTGMGLVEFVLEQEIIRLSEEAKNVTRQP